MKYWSNIIAAKRTWARVMSVLGKESRSKEYGAMGRRARVGKRGLWGRVHSVAILNPPISAAGRARSQGRHDAQAFLRCRVRRGPDGRRHCRRRPRDARRDAGDATMQLTVREAASYLHVDEATVRRWIARRALPVHRANERLYLNAIELWEWATENGIPVSRTLLEQAQRRPDQVPPLSALLSAGGIHHDVSGSDKTSVLREVVQCLPLPAEIDREFLVTTLEAREAMGSTGVGDGIAIPHVRNPILLHVAAPFVTLCLLRHPVEFGALDGKPVHALFTVISTNVPRTSSRACRRSRAGPAACTRRSRDAGRAGRGPDPPRRPGGGRLGASSGGGRDVVPYPVRRGVHRRRAPRPVGAVGSDGARPAPRSRDTVRPMGLRPRRALGRFSLHRAERRRRLRVLRAGVSRARTGTPRRRHRSPAAGGAGGRTRPHRGRAGGAAVPHRVGSNGRGGVPPRRART